MSRHRTRPRFCTNAVHHETTELAQTEITSRHRGCRFSACEIQLDAPIHAVRISPDLEDTKGNTYVDGVFYAIHGHGITVDVDVHDDD